MEAPLLKIIDGISGYLSEETYADYVKNIKRVLFDPNYHEVSKNASR